MQRVGFIFRIKPELKDEYKKAHDEIWPEMAEAINICGARNYSIFFREDGTLFAYLEVDDFKSYKEKISIMDVNRRWQKHMERFFVKENKNLLGPEVEMLEEVFHLD